MKEKQNNKNNKNMKINRKGKQKLKQNKWKCWRRRGNLFRSRGKIGGEE